MKRLTTRTSMDGKAKLIVADGTLSDKLIEQIAIQRLAEYEDIGLEPEKIVFLKNVVDDAFSDKPEFTEHIRELLRAEKDGRLVILPCKMDKEE